MWNNYEVFLWLFCLWQRRIFVFRVDAHFPDLLHLTCGRWFDSSKEDFSWLGATAVVLCPAKFNVLLDRIKCVYGFWWNLKILGLLNLLRYGKMNQVLTHRGGLTLRGVGSIVHTTVWLTRRVFIWLSLAYIYSCWIITIAWYQMVPLRMRHGLGVPLWIFALC